MGIPLGMLVWDPMSGFRRLHSKQYNSSRYRSGNIIQSISSDKNVAKKFFDLTRLLLEVLSGVFYTKMLTLSGYSNFKQPPAHMQYRGAGERDLPSPEPSVKNKYRF